MRFRRWLFGKNSAEFVSSEDLHNRVPGHFQKIMRWDSYFDWFALGCLSFILVFIIKIIIIPIVSFFLGWGLWLAFILFGLLIVMVYVWKNRVFAPKE